MSMITSPRVRGSEASGPRKVKMGATEQKGRMKETEEHTEMCRLPG